MHGACVLEWRAVTMIFWGRQIYRGWARDTSCPAGGRTLGVRGSSFRGSKNTLRMVKSQNKTVNFLWRGIFSGVKKAEWVCLNMQQYERQSELQLLGFTRIKIRHRKFWKLHQSYLQACSYVRWSEKRSSLAMHTNCFPWMPETRERRRLNRRGGELPNWIRSPHVPIKV